MSETRLDFWQRQTLREKQADILKDWENDKESANKELQTLKDQLEKAEKVIEQYGDQLNYSSDPEEYGSLSFEDGSYYDMGQKARAYFQEKQDQLKGEK